MLSDQRLFPFYCLHHDAWSWVGVLNKYLLNKWMNENKQHQVLCSEPVSLNRPKEQVHHSNAKTRREFISSALGLKSHPTQGNPTRAPNKGVWRFIYRQFFVSVTGVASVTWLARQDERISCLFLVNMTQVLETVVWSLTPSTFWHYVYSEFHSLCFWF